MRGSLLALALLCAAGCAPLEPVPLTEDLRWQDLMQEGHVPNRATVYVPEPQLRQPADLVLAEEAPVSFRDDGHSAYWPQAIPAGFFAELRELLPKRSGYEIALWHEGEDPPASADYELRLTVTRLRLELVDVGMGSAMASLWLLGMVHMATYYNAPDERYRCDYELSVEFVRPKDGAVVHRTRLTAATVQSLTDFQRGWTLYSYWPEQSLRWLPEQDAVTAWEAYGPSVLAACEPHARRDLWIDLMRFLRREPPPELARRERQLLGLAVGVNGEQAAGAEEAAAAFARRSGSLHSLLGASASGDEVQRELWALVGRARPGDHVVLFVAGAGTLLPGGAPGLLLPGRPCRLDLVLEPLRAARRRGSRATVILDLGLFGGERSRAGAPGEPSQVLARLGERLDGVGLILSGATPAGTPGLFGEQAAEGTLDEALQRAIEVAEGAPPPALLGWPPTD